METNFVFQVSKIMVLKRTNQEKVAYYFHFWKLSFKNEFPLYF